MKKKLLLIIFALSALTHTWAQSVNITESVGWLESAYVKWAPVSGAESYNVYYSGEGITDKKIDDQLIRSYGTYFRADVLGLKAGTYTIKVAPVISGSEGTSATTGNITVIAHDRAGFAFTGGGKPGAYNADGTLKGGAQVIYITQKTAKTVTLDVVVDAKGKTETGTGIADILKKREKGKDLTPLVIRIVGKLTESDMPSDVVSASYIDLKNTQNVTAEGVGDDATCFGWGVHVRGSSNIEVRNLAFMRFGDDGVSLEVGNSNIWIHNNDFFYGIKGSGDKAKGDGAMDVKTSALVTVSYNHYWDSGKCNLLGNGTEPEERLTYHHNWYDHSDSRHPRVRCHSVHVYNNYYSNIAKYGAGSTMGSSVFVEANYFEKTKNPMLISMQGSDIAGGKGTFSSENGGIIKAYNNYMDSFSGGYFKPYSSSNTVEFDAYVVTNRDEKVPGTVTAKKGGTSYNNFDTDASIMYSYTPDSPEQAKTKVMQYAGRMQGGDFQPTSLLGSQSDSDDPLAGLSSAIDSYKSALVAVQGDGNGNGGSVDPTDPVDPIDPIDPIDPPVEGDVIHNFTENGTSSSFFKITGSLSKDKTSVSYNGLDLTQCLKMETKTSISFTLTEEADLTLVFGDSFSKKVLINGTAYNPTAGVLAVTLPAGTYEIKKGDTANLFYMSVVYKTTSGVEVTDSVGVTLYPNPVVDNLYIRSGSGVKRIEIYSISGALVQRINSNVDVVDMSNLSAGSYIVNIQTENGSHKQVIVKK